MTASAVAMPRSKGLRSSGRWSRPLMVLFAVIATVLLLGGTYALGAHRSTIHAAFGTAYAAEYQISVSQGGWTYDVPLQVPWQDAQGVLHQGSRPACLPPLSRTMPVKFRWVSAHADGATWRVVVWVDCK
jgi:hypothetical protein